MNRDSPDFSPCITTNAFTSLNESSNLSLKERQNPLNLKKNVNAY